MRIPWVSSGSRGLEPRCPCFFLAQVLSPRHPWVCHGTADQVAKLSPEQEVLARPVTDEGGMGRIGLTAVAEEPAWRLDELKQVVFGPWPEKLFFELWRGDELLGLAACPVPLVDAAGPWTRSAAWCGRVFRRKGMGMEGGSETGHCKDRHRWSKQVPSPDHPYM
ncbi:unnamed protein product, partial [Durusdinium trenchii]